MNLFRACKRPLQKAVFGFTSCLILPAIVQAQPAPSELLPLPLNEVRMFTEALDRIRMAYVEEIDDKTLLENAIKGMLSGLDPHSAYMAGNDYDALQETTTGEFGGLGIEVGRENGYIKVISPIDDTPADRAGIEAGDLIIQINNKPLQQLLPEEAAQMMRGEPGTDVTVTIAREGMEPFDLTITREVIAINSVRSRILESGYAYLRISQFRVNTGEEMQAEILKLQEEHGELKGMVLDLRNNPGGVLQSSVRVVDSFIDDGRIVYTEGRLEGNNMEFSATLNTVAPDLPLVVLINNGSASASEIVAGALQDHGRAIIMGTQSFGKGSVQSVLPLDDTRAIKLTTSLYFTPNGRSIQATGIDPDIVLRSLSVEAAEEGRRFSENDLDGHLSNPEGETGVTEDESKKESKDDNLAESDFQLFEALNLLKGLEIISNINAG